MRACVYECVSIFVHASVKILERYGEKIESVCEQL